MVVDAERVGGLLAGARVGRLCLRWGGGLMTVEEVSFECEDTPAGNRDIGEW